ncbi:MAG: photosystem I assembly protein Ycf3 [candidate division BRC1 bacterium ADurb.BinA364]|nr:MAG: photosystem I assembly protein Ycf3 [candidate division BRC1 bacterium ADurb.BinA364]
MGLRFEHAEWLSLLALVPLIGLFMLWTARRKRRLLQRFAADETLSRLLPSVSAKRKAAKAALLLGAFALAFLALARPQYGSIEQKIQRRGVDLFIAIDVSDSMLAQDIKPDRLRRASEQLKGMIRKLKGDRVGIIVFAGAAFVQCPLTLDYGLAQRLLDTIGPDSSPVKGTELGEAIRLAARNFELNEMGHKVLLLLTDGEDHGADAVEAAKAAAAGGVIIYAIGIGSREGDLIPLPGGGFKSDKEGHKVNSRLDFETLTKVAAATGGKAVLARESGFMELDAVYDDMQATVEKKQLESATHSRFRERFQYFLLPAIVFLLIESLMSERRRRPRGAERSSGAAAAALLLLLLAPRAEAFSLSDPLARRAREGNRLVAQGQYAEAIETYKTAQADSPESPELHYNIGVALAGQGKYEEAIASFGNMIAADAALKARAFYNQGYCRYRQGEQAEETGDFQSALEKYQGAMEDNREALKLTPGDDQAKHNYEQAKRAWKRLYDKLKNQQEQSQDPNRQNQNEQDQQQDRDSSGESPRQEQQDQSQQSQDEGEQGETDQEQSQQDQAGEQERTDSGEQSQEAQAQEEERDAGQPQEGLTEEQARRILNRLGEENADAFRNLFNLPGPRLPASDKDW